MISSGSTDIFSAVCGSDLVMIATPVKSIYPIMKMLKHAIDLGDLASHAIITDVGSTKVSVAKAADEILVRTIILLVGIRLQVQKGRALTPEMVSFLYSIRSFMPKHS